MNDCVLKVGALHARHRREALAAKALAPPRPVLWIISPGRPETAMERWAIRRMRAWPAGCYASAPHGPRLVVTSELPRTRETLLVRMMGAGDTVREALAELRALSSDAWEHAVLMPLFTTLRHDLPRIGWTVEMEEDPMMRTYAEMKELYEADRAEARREGIEKGIEKGIERGLVEGRLLTLRELIERRLRRSLDDAERSTLQSRLKTHGPARLDEVVLDFAPAAIASWLADPDAR